MDKNTKKKVVRKKSHTPKKNTEELTDRVRDAINNLKRYESPEVLREVNQISTPVSCPTYPIMQRYNRYKQTSTEKPKSKASSNGPNPSLHSLYRIRTPSDGHKSSKKKKSRKGTTPNRPPEISLATYLKSSAKNANTSTNPEAGKNNKFKNSRSKSVQKSQNTPMNQSADKNRALIRSLDRKKPVYVQDEPTVRCANIVPLHEVTNKQRVRTKFVKCKHSKTYCPGCSNTINPNTPQSAQKKRTPCKITSADEKHEQTFTYYISPADLTANLSIDTPSKPTQQKPARKMKKKKIVRSKERSNSSKPNPEPEEAMREVTWNTEDTAAFRMLEARRGENRGAGADLRPSLSKSSQLEAKPSTIFAAGSSSGGDVSYRMCKQCPLRQLISKIDPAVGHDKRTYPVVAFTCCRKPPSVKSVSTST